MLDLFVLVGFFVLILGSGVVATNFYCRMAYNQCPQCGSFNVKRRDQCRRCATPLG